MPRIRTLKPEHKQHRKIGPLSDREYRLWVGLVTEADDDGRFVADPAQLRALIFPYHPKVSPAHISAALERLASIGLIRRYSINGTAYADLPSWRDHQRLDRAHYIASKLPSYQTSDDAESIRRLSIVEPESTARLQPRNFASDMKVDDAESTCSQGREGNLTTQGSQKLPRVSLSDPDSPEALLAWLNAKAGRSYRPVAQNLDLIRARLNDGIQPWQLRAIVSRKVREWNHAPQPGDKDMRRYLRPETLFGKAKCEQYVGELPAQREEE